MSRYKEQISALLQSRLNTGLTQAQLSRNLGFKGKGNVISMHLDPKNQISPYPMNRLPALARECGLNARECMLLVISRIKSHPNQGGIMDMEVLKFIMKGTHGSKKEFDLRQKEIEEDSHAH